ncbi:MAG: ATP-binding protein [Planctomycetota bacterium]
MSLATRFSIASALLVVVSSLVLGGLVFGEFEKHLASAKLADLQRGVELQGLRWMGVVDRLRRDVRFLARTPPVQGIVRAVGAGGVDPRDGSKLEVWFERLETIFEQLLLNNDSYVQARYIGLADDGRELVRVDRDGPGGAVHRVVHEQLQAKGDRYYVLDISDVPAGEFYVSATDLNREREEIVQPFALTLRIAMPVHGGNGQPFGLMVINLDLSRAIGELGRMIRDGWGFHMVDQNGHYLHEPSGERLYGFEFGREPAAFADFPFLEHASAADTSGVVRRVDGDHLVVAHRVDFGGVTSPRSVTFLVDTQSDVRWAAAWQAVQHIGIYVVLLLAAAVTFGVWFSRRISRPILGLADAVAHARTEGATVQLPANLTGEAGVLGAALQRSYDRLLQRQRALERSNKELDQFAYVASHDLQEPVRTISTFADMLKTEQGERLDDEGRRQLQFLVESCARMRSIIHSLLEYGRLGREVKPAPLDCRELLDEIRADLASRLAEAGGRLEVGPMPTLVSDRDQLRMLFQNLIVNALKFRRDGVAPFVSVTARPGSVPGSWHFVVSDNGIGVPVEHRERIFLIFQRLHSRAAYDGTGIGLAHCRKIVDLHGGRIWVEDSDLGGAAFHCELESLQT